MPYTKQTWADNDPTKPLSAARMNVLETQYDEAVSDSVQKLGIGAGQVYIRNGAGSQSGIPYAGGAASASTIVLRTSTGAVFAGAPTDSAHAATKLYVDNLVSDTGSRQLSGLTPPSGLVVNSYKLRRFGPMVELYVSFTNNSGAQIPTVTFPQADYLPEGFRPTEPRVFGQSVNGGSVTGVFAVGSGASGVRSFTVASGATVQASVNWMTNEAFPTNLPGTAA